jgi:hypothetical protein
VGTFPVTHSALHQRTPATSGAAPDPPAAPLLLLGAHARFVAGAVLALGGFVMIGLSTQRFVARARIFRRICPRLP